MAQVKNHGIRHVVQHKHLDGVLRFVTIEGGDTKEVEDALAEALLRDYPDDFTLIGGKIAKPEPAKPASASSS